MDDFTQIGLGGLVAILILREVFAFLRVKRNQELSDMLRQHIKDDQTYLKDIQSKVSDLHVWHNRTDEDGVPVWYVRKSLEASVEKLATAIEHMGELLKEIHDQQAATRRELRELRDAPS